MSPASDAAAAAAAGARRAWREHLDNCAQCANERHNRPALRVLCAEGVDLRGAARLAELDLAEARQADRATLPGQAELPLNLPGQATLPGMLP